MAITPARTFRLNREDRRLLAELARRLKTNQTEAMRLLIRAAVADLRSKDIKLQAKGKKIND